MLRGELDEGFVLYATGSNEDHAVAGVVFVDVVLEVRLADGEDVLAGSEDCSAERLACLHLNDELQIIGMRKGALSVLCSQDTPL